MDSASQAASGSSDGLGLTFNRLMGLSFVASMASNPYIWDSVRLLVLGSLIETGRRLCQWLMERFKFQYCITAQFTEGDPSYEWIVLFLTQENVWRRSRDFRVNEKNSKRKWGLKLGPEVDGNADYVPTYKMPQLFRWKGYWVEIKRSQDRQATEHQGGYAPATIFLSIYTLNMNILYNFVEATRVRYKEVSRPNVTVHMADMPTYGPGFVWSNVKHKARRPLSSIILMEGVVDSLVKDAQEFIDTEEWYIEAGIPHRRGYLLYGPPGTGKTSTIYALAGELGLEIYALSLSSGFVDDSFLQKAASSIPKNSILLIEDIDCAFPSREDEEDQPIPAPYGFVSGSYPPGAGRKSAVTLSGLLNVIDGVGSEEGKLFFATTNYIDRLDPALLRPGRIDMKIQYKFATKAQALALFLRFFARAPTSTTNTSTSTLTLHFEKQDATITPTSTLTSSIPDLAAQFTAHIPEHEFSTAELQGFLLSCKRDPIRAVTTAAEWVAHELGERGAKHAREEERKMKAREKREERERRQMEGAVAKFGGMVGGMVTGGGGGGGMVRGGMVTGGADGSGPGPAGLVVGDITRTPPTPSPAYEESREVVGTSVSPLAIPASELGNADEVEAQVMSAA
ncbi:P-loop containing nucleoside triphosphate hydrolase protein [Lyophyllum atratum]|nr:P-loop containing nucleoside triphosphate hydrolase protein [Lyophyllum atratum]